MKASLTISPIERKPNSSSVVFTSPLYVIILGVESLRHLIGKAADNHVAIGHFNASTVDGVWAIARAAQSLNLPVIIGASEGERDFFGVRQIAAVVKSVREELNHPIFLNADHTYSFDRVKEAVDAGFDAVILDGSKLPFEENIEETKKSVQYARQVNPEIIVEGELGYIGTSSKVLDSLPEGVTLEEKDLPGPKDAARFVSETGVDLFAPAVGNVHGMFRVGGDPALHIDLVKRVREAAKVPLVLHGASGNSDDDVRRAIAAGVAIVHVNTELRVAYRDALKLSLQDNPDEVAPYKVLKLAMFAMEKVVEKKLELFNGQ